MTAIACYFQREHGTLYTWAAADSRVSQQREDFSYKVLHDHAVKVFSIPFDVVSERTRTCVYSGSFGYCYSGSSLTGLNSHAAFSHLVRLLKTPDAGLPTLRQITDFAAGVLQQYALAYGWNVGLSAACECAILGQCPVAKTQQIFMLRPDTNPVSGVFEFRIESLDSGVEGNYALLGDEKEKVTARIEKARARATDRSINWYRAPWHGIQDAIDSNAFETIGGHVQIGLAHKSHFQILSRNEETATKAAPGVPEFLGLKVDDKFWQIGPCELGLPPMKGLRGFPLAEFP